MISFTKMRCHEASGSPIPPLPDPDLDSDPVARVDRVDLMEVDFLVGRVDWVAPVALMDRADREDWVGPEARRGWTHSPRVACFLPGKVLWAS